MDAESERIAESGPSPQPYLLLWAIPIVSSCPAHGCWLEETLATRGYFGIWEFDPPTPRPAQEHIMATNDQRTEDAIVQRHTMEAAATAVMLLENGAITGSGTDAALFRPVHRYLQRPCEHRRQPRDAEGGHRPRCPYVVNMHVKDFAFSRKDRSIGFTLAGAPLGEGLLPYDYMIDKIKPAERGISQIIEHWLPWQGTEAETLAMEFEWTRHNLEFLRSR